MTIRSLSFAQAHQSLRRQRMVTELGTHPMSTSISTTLRGPPSSKASSFWNAGHDRIFEHAPKASAHIPAPSAIATDLGASPIGHTLSGALSSPITPDSEDHSRGKDAKKARSEPQAPAVKAWPVARGQSQPAYRGAGSAPLMVAPLTLQPTGNVLSSSSGAAGAKKEDYNEVFGPAAAAASQSDPPPLALPPLPLIPSLVQEMMPPMHKPKGYEESSSGGGGGGEGGLRRSVRPRSGGGLAVRPTANGIAAIAANSFIGAGNAWRHCRQRRCRTGPVLCECRFQPLW